MPNDDFNALLQRELELPEDQRMNNPELQVYTGWSARSIRRRKAKLRQVAQATPTPELPPNSVPTRGKVSRYTEGVGWDSVEYKYDNPAEKALLDYEADLLPLLDVFSNNSPIPSQNPPENDYFEQFSAADFQLGKAVESGGGTPETLKRVKSSLNAFVQRVLKSQPKAIVVTDLGGHN